VTFYIQGPRDIVILCFDKGFLIKVPSMFLISSTKIECLTQSIKEGMVVDPHCLLVLGVEGSTGVSD